MYLYHREPTYCFLISSLSTASSERLGTWLKWLQMPWILQPFWYQNSNWNCCFVTGHAMPIRSLTFSPDSQLLITASDDGHIKMYDVYPYIYAYLIINDAHREPNIIQCTYCVCLLYHRKPIKRHPHANIFLLMIIKYLQEPILRILVPQKHLLGCLCNSSILLAQDL